MGQTLSSPSTKKHSECGGNDRFYFGVSEMQGWRISMEDAHAVVLDLDEGNRLSNTFFAVYDGHGGGTVARYAGQNVHKRLISEESYHQHQFTAALKKAFLGTDEDLLADPSHTLDPSGCTAVAVLVTSDNKVYVANAGDSRSVIGIKGQVKPLSFDHKPASEGEKIRIQEAGGYVEFGRVNGNLALSRALGDFEFKKNYSLSPEKQIITANPDVTLHELSDDDEFLVLACDGIWDCLSSQQVVDIVRRQVAEGKELSEICEMICDLCLAPDTSSGAGYGCDNMTILIVAILNGRTKEEWYTWVQERVANNYGYQTPTTLPTLYSSTRLMSFRSRMEATEQTRQQNNRIFSSNGITLFSNGGVTHDSLNDSLKDSPPMTYDDEGNSGAGDGFGDIPHFLRQALGLGKSDHEMPDATSQLRARLEEFDGEIQKDELSDEEDINEDGELQDFGHISLKEPPSNYLPNGDSTSELEPGIEHDTGENIEELQ